MSKRRQGDTIGLYADTGDQLPGHENPHGNAILRANRAREAALRAELEKQYGPIVEDDADRLPAELRSKAVRIKAAPLPKVSPKESRPHLTAQPTKEEEGINLSAWLNRFACLAGLGLVGAAIAPHINIQKAPSPEKIYTESARTIAANADQLQINSMTEVEAKRCAQDAAFLKVFGFQVNTDPSEIVSDCTRNWPKR